LKLLLALKERLELLERKATQALWGHKAQQELRVIMEQTATWARTALTELTVRTE
jgi:hypothetical protein